MVWVGMAALAVTAALSSASKVLPCRFFSQAERYSGVSTPKVRCSWAPVWKVRVTRPLTPVPISFRIAARRSAAPVICLRSSWSSFTSFSRASRSAPSCSNSAGMAARRASISERRSAGAAKNCKPMPDSLPG